MRRFMSISFGSLYLKTIEITTMITTMVIGNKYGNEEEIIAVM